MATPTAHSSEIQPPNTSAHNPNMTHSEESPQSPSLPKQLKEIPQSSKTLTLEVLLPRNSNQQPESKVEEDQKQGDVEMLTPAPQPFPDHRVSTTLATINVTYSRRAPTRKKLAQQKRRAALEKKSSEKLEILKKNLKPIPFTPPKKNLDFSRHEQLLRRLGLWDFVHLEFDTNIRTDLIAQLIATYNQSSRCSYVGGSRIGVNRADLSRALKLPGKKDKININVNVSDGSVEIPEKESEESIKFIEEVVSNWMLLHDDMWMMPDEVLKTTKMIKEGNFEKIDLTSLVWYMVEKELLSPQLGRCYYASHMQCLIQCQKKELFLTDEVKEVVEVTEEMEVKEEVEEDCDGDVKMYDKFDDVKRSELEEHQIMLSLGQENIVDLKENVERSLKKNDENSLKDNVENNLQENVEISLKENFESSSKENVENSSVENVENSSKENVENSLKENVEKEEKEFVGGDNVITFQDNKNEQQFFEEKKVGFEENRNEEEDEHWFSDEKNNVDENEHLLRRCTVDEIRGMDFEEEKKGMDYEEEEKQQEVGEEVEEDGGEHEEEAEEEEQQEEGQFSPSTRGETLEMVTSANLIQGMEAAQVPFRSEVHICDDDLPGDFLASRVGTNAIPGGSSSHFVNGNKREMVHDNELSHHSLTGGNKRLRSVGSWDNKSTSEYHMCMDQLQHLIGKARMLYEAKEQACEESSMNQQILLNEVQKRDSMIELLHKTKYEVEQRRQLEVYRLERELYFMGNLLDGYKKILKETRKEFAEYRARCPQLDEPLYKDVRGGAGLVLSAVELEKQRLKQEEEVRMNRLLIEKKFKDFEGGWIAKFEAHKDTVQLMYNRLLDVENLVKSLKQLLAKQKVSETSECAPNELSSQ